MGDLKKNLLEISSFEDAILDPMEDLENFKLLRIYVIDLAGSKRQPKEVTDSANEFITRLNCEITIDDERNAPRSNGRKDETIQMDHAVPCGRLLERA